MSKCTQKTVTDMPPRGIYVLLIKIGRKTLEIGALGKICFEGEYAYVGSDQRGGRLERHCRKEKPKKWHIDYLTNEGEVLGAWVMPLPKSAESELAEFLADRFPVTKGFGNSDCRDAGHLFKVDERLEDSVAEFASHKGVAYMWWVQNSKNCPASMKNA